MTAISDRSELARAMTCGMAIVVLYAEWSFQAKNTFKMVEVWDRHWREAGRTPGVDVFVVISDDGFVAEWLRSEPRLKSYLSTGWGEVIWLSRGRVLDVQWSGITEESLTEKAIALWDCR